MLEMIVCHDGGIPLIYKTRRGASDNTVFKERSEKLIENFKASETPRYLVADCTVHRSQCRKLEGFTFHYPNTGSSRFGETIDKALATPNDWQTLDDGRNHKPSNLNIMAWNNAGTAFLGNLAEKGGEAMDKQVEKEAAVIEKQLFHLQAKRFACTDDATAEAQALARLGRVMSSSTMKSLSGKLRGQRTPKERPGTYEERVSLVAQSQADTDKIAQTKAKEAH
jgi:hypothetical protein